MKKAKQNATPASNETLFERYRARVDAGELKDDAAQLAVLTALEALVSQLSGWKGVPSQTNAGGLSWLFKKPASDAPKGVYLWGNVGRGKSMLMELFFEAAPVEKKLRVHFHAFMQEVHARIHQLRQDISRETGAGADPVARLAQLIASETSLLCFDELQATDVADATLLYRLFCGLFDAGVVIVSTSNHPSSTLYTGRVQRERFDKFVALIEEKMNVVSLSSPLDYRRTQIKSLETRYFYPLGTEADAFVEHALHSLCQQCQPKRDTLVVQGRKIPFTMYDGSIARFTFQDLCETALGPADYLALAKRCDVLILTGIPALAPEKRNEAKRFVTLVDALYEGGVKLLITAEVPPEGIYEGGDGSFEFARTVSRLIEMQSEHWSE